VSKANSNPITSGDRARLPLWIASGVLAAFCAIGLLAVWFDREPTYAGKPVSFWFENSVPMSSTEYEDSECRKAFSEMEGNAIPYLNRWLIPKPPGWNGIYAFCWQNLPSKVQETLPKPRDAAFYRDRRNQALRLLGDIGMAQRFRLEEGLPVAQPSISLAVPGIAAGLMSADADLRCSAAQAAWFIGPSAAPTIPNLIKLAKDPNEPAAFLAIQGLGLMGGLASNAVPALIAIATDDGRREKTMAIVSLGEIGAPARPAVPVLVTLMSNTNEALRIAATRSLGEIGFTPDEAVPALVAMMQGTNGWLTDLATLALWNRNHQDPDLQAHLVAVLHGDKRGWLLSCLAGIGTNAAPLVPEIKLLVNDPDPNVSRFAKRALRSIQPTVT
jgi:HEAT repeat protein